MAIDTSKFGEGAQKLSNGAVVIEDGMELFRSSKDDDVWFSNEPAPDGWILAVYVNPPPEEIQPHWYRATAKTDRSNHSTPEGTKP